MPFQIPQEMLSTAYFSSNGEPAWPPNEVLKVIAWATASRVAILGVEVWLPTIPGPTIPTPYVYTSESEQQPGEDSEKYLLRANLAADEYVKTFKWDDADKKHHGMQPFFNLAFSDDSLLLSPFRRRT